MAILNDRIADGGVRVVGAPPRIEATRVFLLEHTGRKKIELGQHIVFDDPYRPSVYKILNGFGQTVYPKGAACDEWEMSSYTLERVYPA